MDEYDPTTDDAMNPSQQKPLPSAPRPRPRPRPHQQFMCTGCGYRLSGLSIDSLCPECGTPVMHSMGEPAPTSGYAIASLVLGILTIMGCALYGLPSLVFGPLALVFSSMANRRVREGTAGGATKGLATAGFWCGLVGLVLGGIGLIAMLSLFLIPLLAGQYP